MGGEVYRQEWLNGKNIKFVLKEANPPNVAEASPIEDFWTILSRGICADRWKTTSTINSKKLE